MFWAPGPNLVPSLSQPSRNLVPTWSLLVPTLKFELPVFFSFSLTKLSNDFSLNSGSMFTQEALAPLCPSEILCDPCLHTSSSWAGPFWDCLNVATMLLLLYQTPHGSIMANLIVHGGKLSRLMRLFVKMPTCWAFATLFILLWWNTFTLNHLFRYRVIFIFPGSCLGLRCYDCEGVSCTDPANLEVFFNLRGEF